MGKIKFPKSVLNTIFYSLCLFYLFCKKWLYNKWLRDKITQLEHCSRLNRYFPSTMPHWASLELKWSLQSHKPLLWILLSLLYLIYLFNTWCVYKVAHVWIKKREKQLFCHRFSQLMRPLPALCTSSLYEQFSTICILPTCIFVDIQKYIQKYLIG